MTSFAWSSCNLSWQTSDCGIASSWLRSGRQPPAGGLSHNCRPIHTYPFPCVGQEWGNCWFKPSLWSLCIWTAGGLVQVTNLTQSFPNLFPCFVGPYVRLKLGSCLFLTSSSQSKLGLEPVSWPSAVCGGPCCSDGPLEGLFLPAVFDMNSPPEWSVIQTRLCSAAPWPELVAAPWKRLDRRLPGSGLSLEAFGGSQQKSSVYGENMFLIKPTDFIHLCGALLAILPNSAPGEQAAEWKKTEVWCGITVGGLVWGWLPELHAAQFPDVILPKKAPWEPTSESPVVMLLPGTVLPQVTWARWWMNSVLGCVGLLRRGQVKPTKDIASMMWDNDGILQKKNISVKNTSPQRWERGEKRLRCWERGKESVMAL